MLSLHPIGVIESCYPDKFGTPRQPGLVPEALAQIKIDRQWQPEQSLQGLEGFSHVWILFWFHKNSNQRYHAKVHPPRMEGESVGVFATRSPHRPNPIGLSLVKLEKVEQDRIFISGVDLVDGTPILDIKPYLASIESQPEAKSGWSASASTSLHEIQWTELQLQQIAQWAQRIQQPDLRNLVEKTLQLDPRPQVYKGEGEDKYRETHAVRFYDGDVHFSFPRPGVIQIKQILF
jgi:tRNA (adenine37-N6)-methyltransferase